MGYRDPLGYGRWTVDGKTWLTHRYAFGPTPSDTLHHVCQNPPCCNPRHLVDTLSRYENISLHGTGASAVNAAKTACIRGHEFTPENTIIVPRGERLTRRCRACKHLVDQAARRARGVPPQSHSQERAFVRGLVVGVRVPVPSRQSRSLLGKRSTVHHAAKAEGIEIRTGADGDALWVMRIA